ncbi:entericidin A/B family lipoprotein [Limnobacter parvus]|uniref:Entericidin A/B family lipoprotein n=1 Tax=Limnobacter parvus TaxID=2939690 RepID=A0ABT1XHS1_9BURK|nr:entericidin A/B family lipoprotein [Limnobacter parvus]MCR2746820.1 entericidin A/B family lipoprotein [Limnobacter parvus]
MKIISALLLALSALSLSACNTVEGVGKDLKAGGEAIERTAEENKK